MQAKDIRQSPLPSDLLRNWRGLGGWNYYFLLKLALLWYGYLNFHPLANLIFMAFLLFPLPTVGWHRLRHWIAIPIGLALFYHDTWFPDIHSVIGQSTGFTTFSGGYLVELANRFINWEMLGAAFVLLVVYLFLARWIRVTVITVIAIVWLNIITIVTPAISLLPTTTTTASSNSESMVTASANSASNTNDQLSDTLPPTSANLTAYLNQFYAQEKLRHTTLPATLSADAQPFDLLIISICSLAWSDMEAAQLMNHPIWKKFDIMFNNYNSAASYSGPAVIRLLRANCGQTSHAGLYQPAAKDCYLFDNLAKLGFGSELMLDHTGIFGNFLQEIRQEGDLTAPLMSQNGIERELVSFDGGPIYSDSELLNRWLDKQKTQPANSRSVTLFNTIALHDGDRFIGGNSTAPYPPRAQKLLDDLNSFFDQLQKSGRKVMIVMIPEHGANMTGDKLQMPWLRDLPSLSITHVPVGIKLIGMKAPHPDNAQQVDTSTSYLALSELISRMVDGKAFNATNVDWQALTKNLPETPIVSENEATVVMEYQGKPYIRLDANADWVPYPQ